MKRIVGMDHRICKTTILETLEMCGDESTAFEFSSVKGVMIHLETMLRMTPCTGNWKCGKRHLRWRR